MPDKSFAATWIPDLRAQIGSSASEIVESELPFERASTPDLKSLQSVTKKSWLSALLKHLDSPASPPPLIKPNATEMTSELESQIVQDLLLVTLRLLPPSATNQAAKPKYSAIHRLLLVQLLQSLSIPIAHLYSTETLIAQELFLALEKAGADSTSNENASNRMATTSASALAASAAKSANWRKLATAGGFALGGIAMGLTGGLAAPAIAPLLIGASGGTLAFLGGASGTIMLGGLFGVAGGGLAAKRVEKRVAGIEHFEFEKTFVESDLPQVPSLHATIVCSGLLLTETDYKDPFGDFFQSCSDRRDVYALKIDQQEFIALGKSINSYTRDLIKNKAIAEVLKRTSVAVLLSSVALPRAVWGWTTSLLDGAWVRCLDKAKKAGEILADVLLERVQGDRPVMLVGTSFGAVVIFSALSSLATKAPGRADLVYSATLISLPLAPSDEQWKAARSVVSGPISNCWSDSDWCLTLLARAAILSGMSPRTPAGLGNVEQPGIVDVDVSDLIEGHLKLVKPDRIRAVLDRVGLQTA